RQAAERPVPVEPELFQLLQAARGWTEETEGAFDLTSGPLIRLWGAALRAGTLPLDEEIAAARGRVGMQFVQLDAASRTVRFLRPGMELHFGAMGKGYALGRAGAHLRRLGVGGAFL
ncbi:MAG: FAD:protein FMN transferase, partial [Chloroflexota bacterium]